MAKWWRFSPLNANLCSELIFLFQPSHLLHSHLWLFPANFCSKICTEEKKLRLWLDFRLIVSHRSSAPLKSWYCNRIEPNKSLPRRLPPKMHQLSECKFPDRKYPRFLQTQHSQVSGGLARARWAGDLYKEGSRCFDWWRPVRASHSSQHSQSHRSS